jgi:hypothetical protein
LQTGNLGRDVFMRLIERSGTALLLTLALSACNTSEALTPQADIGTNRRSSTPVTQADTDRMAASSSAPVANDPGRTFRPQNTLEAQAQAMQGGVSSPASSGPAPQWQGQDQPQAAQSPTQNTAQSTAPQNASLPPAAAVAGTIRFLPIIGAPVQAVTPLSRQLGAQARASGLTIRPSGDAGAEHILKGYFSAFDNEGKVTVIYVWDVLDGAGNRLHRMQGQADVPAKGADPWAAVPASTMEEIAAKTIQDYLSWRRARAG